MIKTKEDREKSRKRKAQDDLDKAKSEVTVRDDDAVSGNHRDKFDEVDDVTECDVAAGDFLDGDRGCNVCCARMLCLLNAVKLGNLVRDSLPDHLKVMLDTASRAKDINSLIAESANPMVIPANIITHDTKKKKKRRVGKLQ